MHQCALCQIGSLISLLWIYFWLVSQVRKRFFNEWSFQCRQSNLNQEITTLSQTKLITLRSPWKSSVKIYPWKTYQSMKKKSTSNSSETWSQGYLRREISFKMGSQKLWNSPIITISRDIFEFFNKLNSWKLILLDKSFETRLYRKTLLKFRFPEKATTLITL